MSLRCDHPRGSPNSGGFARVARTQGTTVTKTLRPSRPVLTLAALIVTALALAGCGRKGGLDLPPSAGAEPEAQTAQAPATGNSAEEKGRSLFNPAATDPERPTAAKGRKRGFVLDPLLD